MLPRWWEVAPVVAGLAGLGWVAYDRRRRARVAAARVRARRAARRIQAEAFPGWSAGSPGLPPAFARQGG